MKVVCRRHIFSISHFPVVIPITSSRSWTNQDSPFLHGARARRTLKKVRERYSLSHVTPNAPARHCESLGDRSSISANSLISRSLSLRPYNLLTTEVDGSIMEE